MKGGKVLSGLMTFIPLLHLGGVVAGVVPCARRHWGWGVAWLAVSIYLVPPLLTRLTLALSPPLRTRSPMYSREHMVWWTTMQFQSLFIRFPFFEELLRTVPALYSCWLRLWGAKIGKFVFWGAQLRLMDRPFLCVGDSAIIGYGVGFTAHHVNWTGDKQGEVVLARNTVGKDAILGGMSGLTPGAEVAPGELLPSTVALMPFCVWEGGRKRRKSEDEIPQTV